MSRMHCTIQRASRGIHKILLYAIRRLFYVPIHNPDLVVPQLHVDTTKILRSSQPIKEIMNSRQWIVLIDGDFIQRFVDDTHSELAILLIHKEDWDSIL